jgi:hypothetical protein
MTETIACAVERLIAHKRARGCKYHSEARELALLVRFAATRSAASAGSRPPCWRTSWPPGPGRVRAASITCSASCGACWTGRSPGACWRPPRCRPAATGSPSSASPSCSTPPRPASWMPRPRWPTTRGPLGAARPTGRTGAIVAQGRVQAKVCTHNIVHGLYGNYWGWVFNTRDNASAEIDNS